MLPFPSSITVRPDPTPPTMESPALQAAIKNTIAQQDDNAVRQLLGLPMTKQALRQGAAPTKVAASLAVGDMRALLTYTRRKNKLYPPNASRAQETGLDQALRDGGLDFRAQIEAKELLDQAMFGKNVQEAWRDAVKHQQLDVQRAILLLYADQDRGFRLKQEDAVTDKGVAEVMKEIPYFSPKRKLPQNFNGKARFPGKNEKIVCRHLAEHRQAVQERSPQIKFDDAQYASEEEIAAHVSYDTDAKHRHLMARAAEACLFYNHDFGKALVQQLAAMATEGEPTRLISLRSTKHAMSVGLKIKEKDGKPHYVAELFDPNRTTSPVRIASDSLHTFETLTLENFIADADLYKLYYPEPDGLSMMFVRPPPQEGQAMTDPAPGAVENRTLTSSIEDKEINATALFYMLRNGFAGDLRRLKGEIASRPEKERIQLLAAKDSVGDPGLPGALHEGHADAIKAFGELLSLVPPEARVKLLAAKGAEGYPGLYLALRRGHADAIKAFGELLSLVPAEARVDLLAAKDAKGYPGLYLALLHGHADAIRTFGELLSLAPPEQRTELLAANSANKTSGLFMALLNGHAEAIRAFGELLPLVPLKQRAELLAVTTKGRSGLARALKEGKLKALEQYIEIVKNTAPTLRPQERAALLKYIRKSHAVQRLGIWFNFSHYEALKKKNPDFYLRFKEMKNALKPKTPAIVLPVTSGSQTLSTRPSR